MSRRMTRASARIAAESDTEDTVPTSHVNNQSGPPQSHPPQSHPPQSHPPQSHPPQSHPPQSHPPQSRVPPTLADPNAPESPPRRVTRSRSSSVIRELPPVQASTRKPRAPRASKAPQAAPEPAPQQEDVQPEQQPQVESQPEPESQAESQSISQPQPSEQTSDAAPSTAATSSPPQSLAPSTAKKSSKKSSKKQTASKPEPVKASPASTLQPKRMKFDDEDDVTVVPIAAFDASEISQKPQAQPQPESVSLESLMADDDEEDDDEAPEAVSLEESRQTVTESLKAQSEAEKSRRDQDKAHRKQLTAGRQAASSQKQDEQLAAEQAEQQRIELQRQLAAESKKLREVDESGRLDFSVLQAAEAERKEKVRKEREDRKRQRQAEQEDSQAQKIRRVDLQSGPSNVQQHGAFTVVVAPTLASPAYNRPSAAALAFRSRAASAHNREAPLKKRAKIHASNFATVRTK